MNSAALDLLTDSFTGRSLIEASAGTGKTWTLTALYARLRWRSSSMLARFWW